HRRGLLQSLDPRTKLVTFLLLILTASLATNWETLAFLCLAASALAVLSHTPLGQFLKRVWLFVPLFTGIVAFPAVFSVVTPGEPLLTLVGTQGLLVLNTWELSITEQGLRAATTLILRSGASVSLAVLLVLTTPWANLLKALRVLRIPQVFVAILGMTHRYIFLLLRTANSMFLARKSRTIGRLDAAEQRRWLGGATATLIGKSYQLSDQVYLAMLSRGYRGEIIISDNFCLSTLDWIWAIIVISISVAVLLVDRSF
ncbi:MAG: cobalt ECF transporter T component CbiQ, partial [Chloroflexota bacterium]